jgi:hypothetical protein
MASYRHIEKDGSSYIGFAEGAEYVVSGRRGNWRASLRSNTALGVGETAPESFYADTLQEIDARLGEIALKIAAYRAKARKARHRVDVYEGGDEPVASYPFKTEADAQWNFDYTSRRADEGVEMRLFLNGKEVERHTQPEKKRRSPRRSNTSNGDGTRTVSVTKEQTARQAKSIADLANLRVLPHIEEMRDLAVVYAAAAQERAVAIAELTEDPFNARLLARAQKAHDAYTRAKDKLQYALRLFPLI